eukprot:g6564.t1
MPLFIFQVVQIRSMLPPSQDPASRRPFDDIYCVFELMESDLTTVIKSPQYLSMDHIRFFVYQLLRGLKYVHSLGLIHRDIKPRNLLVNANCDLKICDFGLARQEKMSDGRRKGTAMTDYIATRWYRPPEVILSCPHYGYAVDMWGAGCVLGELLKRKPLFPGRDTKHQLVLVVEQLGIPPPSVVARVDDEDALAFLEALAMDEHVDMTRYFRGFFKPEFSDPLALDLMMRLLQMEPDKRPTAAAALAHPFFEGLHDPNDEPVGEVIPHAEKAFGAAGKLAA